MSVECFDNLSRVCVPYFDQLICSLGALGFSAHEKNTMGRQRSMTTVRKQSSPAEASIEPSGLNLTDEIDIVCPLSINLGS